VLDNRFFRVFQVDSDGAKRHAGIPRDKCSPIRDDGKATSNSVYLALPAISLLLALKPVIKPSNRIVSCFSVRGTGITSISTTDPDPSLRLIRIDETPESRSASSATISSTGDSYLGTRRFEGQRNEIVTFGEEIDE